MRTPFTGCGTALVTPFTRSGSLDEAAVRRLGRRQIDAGTHFLVPAGTTGESPTLSLAEKIRIVELLAEEANGRVPILAGAGGYDTREVIHAVAAMQQAGADGILSVTPYYNKPTQEGLFQHFRAIAEISTLPIVVYNVPGRTGCNIEPATVVRLLLGTWGDRSQVLVTEYSDGCIEAATRPDRWATWGPPARLEPAP